jgi:hypothetical protein
MYSDQLFSGALGAALGSIVALGILASDVAAARFAQGSQLVNLLLRLTVFGFVTVGAAELLGNFFAAKVRANAIWFWSLFAVGFVAVPIGFHAAARRKS